MWCQCGCGQETSLSTQSDTRRGYVKGQPRRFRPGHNHNRRMTARVSGYLMTSRPEHPRAKNGCVYDHVLIAEQALGRYLPEGVEVHHVDENERNNTKTNLVICQDRAYHKLLHVRSRLVRAGGNPNLEKLCCDCRAVKPLDDFNRMASNKSTGRQKSVSGLRQEQRRQKTREGGIVMSYNNEYSGSIVLDIETVGAPECADYLDPVAAPSNYKDAQKIADYIAEKTSERVSKAALEPDLCEVVAIGWSVDGHADVSTREDGPESLLLKAAWQLIGNRLIVGFNVLSFDLPVLIRRSQLLGVPVPAVNLDRYRTPHIDLLERLSFNGKLSYRSLSFYARRFGIPFTDTTSGADIAGMVAKGDWPAVAAHCYADVEKTAALATRLGWLHVDAHAGVL